MNKIPWGPVRSSLFDNFSFGDIKNIVGYANIDMHKLAHLEQKLKGGATKSQLLSAVDDQIGEMEDKQAGTVVSICCEEIMRRKPSIVEELGGVLSRVGWGFSNNVLVPIEIFDMAELEVLPQTSHEDILKAASRLRDGDLSGALSASCGALDSVAGSIYQEFGLGDPSDASFQERIKKSIDAIEAKGLLEKELLDIAWDEKNIKILSHNMIGSLNQAANIMQKLRSDMGDTHGSKTVIAGLVYDSIKWALILLRILAIRKDT